MNKEEILIDNGHLIHYLNDHEFYEYDTLYISTLDYLDKLQRENKKLKDNWNKLKEHLLNLRNVAFTKEFGNEWNSCLSFNEDILPIINKMQELESGDSNE